MTRLKPANRIRTALVRPLTRLRRGLAQQFFGACAIVMYHRVGFLEPDPEQLCMSPELFHAHLEAFSNNFTCLSLGDVVQHLQDKQKLPKQTLCITFDDGYADNFEIAYPMLCEYGIPATVFVSSGGIDQQKTYWWEEYRPSDYVHVSSDVLTRVRRDYPLFDIGGHTVNHPYLAQLSGTEQQDEIEHNRQALAALVGADPTAFAYPFGRPQDWTNSTARAVREAGYQCAVTTDYGIVTHGSPLFSLPRFDVHHMRADVATSFLQHQLQGKVFPTPSFDTLAS